MSLELIKKYKIKAKKNLGQNFLVNDKIVSDISELVEVTNENIIEVWPGYWALTEKLIEKKPKSLNLVELDRDMISILENRKNNWDFDLDWIDFKINNKDILKYEPDFSNYSVIANIPYYITSPILRHFLYNVKNKPKSMVILMQKEVWDKILWDFKWKSSVISLLVEKKAKASECIFVWKDNFIPAPKVDSTVLLFEYHDEYNYLDDDIFINFIKKAFVAQRKKLIKNLTNAWYEKSHILQVFNKLSIEEWVRWEELNISTWCNLISEFNK